MLNVMEVHMKANKCTKWFVSKKIHALEFESFERKKYLDSQVNANVFVTINVKSSQFIGN